jgi:hypothetical protein
MRWLRWAAVTLPAGKGKATVHYWTDDGLEAQEHEHTVHPPQIERMGPVAYVVVWVTCFAVLAVLCLGDLHEAHRRHPMEWGPPS